MQSKKKSLKERKNKMKKGIKIIQLFLAIVLLTSFSIQKQETFSLTVQVKDLRNSNGTVLFALYNREDAFPDEHYKKYFKKLTGKIVNGASSVTFENLPSGKYAVNILHDENNDGKIKKGIILPKEGIGFSNYESIGFSNRPTFKKASFNLLGDRGINIKIIYL
jgi:uncharacterized protein (DUF2141 family)